jgi:hypothetical protein
MEEPSGTWSLAQLLADDVPPSSLVAAYSATIRGIGYLAALNPGLSADSLAYAREGIEAFTRT